MQTYIVVAIKDLAVGVFNRPFFVRSRGEAMRLFTDEVNRKDAANPLSNHPNDFELWFLCAWNDELGEFSANALERFACGFDVRHTE